MRKLTLKAHANGRKIVGQQRATLLGPTCCVHNNVGLVKTSAHAQNVAIFVLKDKRKTVPECIASLDDRQQC